jgi:hypothetical protein
MKRIFTPLVVLMIAAASAAFAQSADRSKWPSQLVHPDMPVYKAGKFKGWNYWDKNDTSSIFMIIENTNQGDLDKYIAQLKAAGFEVKNGNIYHKGLFDVDLQFNAKTILQISSRKIKGFEWPAKLLSGIPELKKGTLTNIIEPSEDMPGYVQLYYVNLTGDDVRAWFVELQKAGFTLEDNFAEKTKAALQGKSYKTLNIQVEENGTNEWMIDFNFSD